MAGDEELKPPNGSTAIGPGLRDDGTDSLSKRATRKLARLEARMERHKAKPDFQHFHELVNRRLDFPNLPGKHLTWRRAGRGSWELITDSNGVLSASTSKRNVVTWQGRSYAWRRVDKQGFWDSDRIEELVNTATHAPVIRKSGSHSQHQVGTRMTLTGRCELQFPVTDSGSPLGFMSAVDETGNSLVEYRTVNSKHQSRFAYLAVEAVISQEALAIPQIELLVAVSSPLLIAYFFESGGGG